MLQNFGTALSREQMKNVLGGQAGAVEIMGTCTANCPSGQSASCTGFSTCTYPPGENGKDAGVVCSEGQVTSTVNCQ